MPLPSLNRLLPLLMVVVLLQCLYNAGLPLSGDEAYYWVWSRHLQAGYHDHPPAIALLIAAVTRLEGDSVMAVRLAAVLTTALVVLLQVRLADAMGGPRAGWLALVIGLALPALQMGFTLATPDDPLALFWTAGLCFALPALTNSVAVRQIVDGRRDGAGAVRAGAVVERRTRLREHTVPVSSWQWRGRRF